MLLRRVFRGTMHKQEDLPATSPGEVADVRPVNPLFWLVRCVDWFESRGVYIPGEESRPLSPWRDFGWLIAVWLVAVGAFVVFFAFAS